MSTTCSNCHLRWRWDWRVNCHGNRVVVLQTAEFRQRQFSSVIIDGHEYRKLVASPELEAQ